MSAASRQVAQPSRARLSAGRSLRRPNWGERELFPPVNKVLYGTRRGSPESPSWPLPMMVDHARRALRGPHLGHHVVGSARFRMRARGLASNNVVVPSEPWQSARRTQRLSLVCLRKQTPCIFVGSVIPTMHLTFPFSSAVPSRMRGGAPFTKLFLFVECAWQGPWPPRLELWTWEFCPCVLSNLRARLVGSWLGLTRHKPLRRRGRKGVFNGDLVWFGLVCCAAWSKGAVGTVSGPL